MIDEGKTSDEYSLVQVENGKFIGFGYFDKSENISEVDALRNYIQPYPDDRDAQQIIKYFLSDRRIRKIAYKV